MHLCKIITLLIQLVSVSAVFVNAITHLLAVIRNWHKR